MRTLRSPRDHYDPQILNVNIRLKASIPSVKRSNVESESKTCEFVPFSSMFVHRSSSNT